MKKGLLTVLLSSLVLVGCQKYDDQFDYLNAQISALKSQVDGLSSLTGQVSSLSGSISGLSAGVAAAQAAASAAGTSADAATAAANGIDLTGLSASLATLQAEVDAVQASLATAATATAVAALQTELDAIDASVTELLATSNVYNQNLTISSASTLDAAFALGNNLNIVNGTVTISQSSSMDAAKLQTVIDKIFTVTGNYTYTAGAATVTAQTFDKLASTGDLTLTVNGPVSAKTLVTAGTVNLGTTFSSKVTSVNMDLLSTVTDIQTGGTSNTVNFASATDVQLGAVAVYTTAMSITTKKGATLDIGGLTDKNAAGTAVDMGLTVNGPKDVTISGWDDSYTGTITATNVENLTISGYEGNIVIGDGVENATVTGGVDVELSSADDLETVDLTTKLFDDPNISATAKASVAYGSYGKENSLTFSSADLTSIKLQGYWLDVNSTDNSNLITVDIDATMRNLTLTNNDNLVTLDVTGSEIANVTMTNNDGIVSAVLDHTTELNYRGATADDTSVVATITGNQGMTSLTWNADNVSTLAVNDNDKLATVDFTGLTKISTLATASGTVNVYDNDITVATATDSSDGVSTQYAIDGATAGANNDALDLGSYATDGGMSTLKTYLLDVLADAGAAGAVSFDTVTTHTIATGANATGETAGAQNSGNASTFESNGGGTADPDSNWVGLVWGNVKSDYVSTNPTSQSAQKEKRAFILDVSTLTAGTSTMALIIDSTQVLALADGSYGTSTTATALVIANTNNLTSIVNQLKTTAAVTRAADLGATLDVYIGAQSYMPSVVLKTGSTEGTNYEGYTDAQITTLFNTHGGNLQGGAANSVAAAINTYDQFTYTVGGQSVTASITLSSGVSAVGATALSAIATAIVDAWNLKYSTTYGTASKTLSFWNQTNHGTAGTIGGMGLKSVNSGSRGYGQTVAFSHSYKASSQMSTLTAGVGTYTFVDWLIGTDDQDLASSDNKASDVDLIITLEETLASGTAINGSAITITTTNDGVQLVELTTGKTITGVLSGTLAGDIFENDAGIYGSISGGGAGDVRDPENADEGLAVTSGSQRAWFTRIHWLG
jgi:hypothetical protein